MENNNRLIEAAVHARYRELDRMIAEYNSAPYSLTEKYAFFLECLACVTELENDGLLIKGKNRKYAISYLKSILDNDGPEYALTIGFSNPCDQASQYEIGVCVRGTPLLKKL